MRIPSDRDFTSTLRSPAVAARVGVWLGICFGLAFVTGLISHEAYVVHPVIPFPARPTWGYRVTQGLHVLSGTAAIPLLLVKLWTVFPKLFARPPQRLRQLAVDGLERASIAVLVAAAVFQLTTGLLNTTQWYPWGFHFRATHYAVAWVAIGALVLHIAVKLPVIRAALGGDIEDSAQDRPTATIAGPLTRRALVRSALLASGVAVLATAGSTVPALRKVSVLGVRSGGGPAGIPINKSAKAADVVATALSPDYRLVIAYDAHEMSLSRADLERLEQHTVELPIACVEGWSASGHWTGVRVRDLLDLVGAPAGRDLRVESLQPRGPFRATTLPGHFADDPLTLLALRLGGEPLAIDHGYPCRLIAPDRPGVLQTKWVGRLEVIT
ncbi:MAG: molybdopterin-dependent oxidoreductase [Propionibacteriales bacterium]|nr:molybdopterin-dependent oxidoreductase [Propionibacteriales bacterium]